MTLLSASVAGTALADPARLISFVEVRSDRADQAVADLRRYAHSLGEGVPQARIELLRELGRPERFVLLESADDLQALTQAEGRSRALLDALTAQLAAPSDRRSHREFGTAAAPVAVPQRTALCAITHLDIGGPVRPLAEEALGRFAAAARGSPGNLGFEVWQQLDRGNHFNIVAVWSDRASLDAFAASPEAREFRASVAPLIGSPYDERLYRREP